MPDREHHLEFIKDKETRNSHRFCPKSPGIVSGSLYIAKGSVDPDVEAITVLITIPQPPRYG